MRSDFADIFEVKSGKIVRRGDITTEWSPKTGRLVTRYRNKSFRRSLIVDTAESDATAGYANGRITFHIKLPPGGKWHSCILYSVDDGSTVHEAPKDCITHDGESLTGRRLASWREAVLKIKTSNEEFRRFYNQSLQDMAALRLPIEGTDHLEFVPAAGVPWFRRPVRPRQPYRLAAERHGLSQLRPRGAGGPGKAAGAQGRRLSRRPAGQDPA